VFIKTLAEAAQRELLLAEFAALRRLSQRGLPHVLELGIADATPFLVTEWIEGESLLLHAAAGPAVDRNRLVLRILHDCGQALAAIHQMGAIHGDVAPQNVLVNDQNVVLIDLGFVTSARQPSSVRGTPATMAPETFAGITEARSDLYSLGMTAAYAALGQFPVQAATAAELIERVIAGVVLPAMPQVMPAVADLLQRLTARLPTARPSSASELLVEVRGLADVAGVDLGPAPALVRGWSSQAVAEFGRQTQIAALIDVVGAAPSLHCLVAAAQPEIKGVVEAALAAHNLSAISHGRPLCRVQYCSFRDEVAQLGTSSITQIADHLVAGNASDLVVVVCSATDPTDALAAALARREMQRHVLLAVARPPLINLPTIELAPLDANQLGVLCTRIIGATPPEAWLNDLVVVCSGSAVRAHDILQSLPGDTPFAQLPSRSQSLAISDAAQEQLAALPLAQRRIALRLAIAGGELTTAAFANMPEVSADDVALTLSNATWGMQRSGAAVHLSEPWRQALLTHAATLVPDAHVLLQAALPLAGGAVDVADHLVDVLIALPAPLRDTALVLQTAAQQLRHGRPAVVRALCTPLQGNVAADTLNAEAALALGDYRAAETLAAAVAQSNAASAAQRRAAVLVQANAQQRTGAITTAVATLAGLASQFPDDDAVRGSYARAAIAAGDYATARAVAAPRAQHDARCAESLGLAAYYEGQLDEAAQWFDQLATLARADHDQHGLARASALHGMVAQQRGDLRDAANHYAATVAQAQAAGQLHLAATAQSNLGAVLCDRGFYATALAQFTDAVRTFTRLGAAPELAAAEANRANALLGLGELDRAAAALAQLRARADLPLHIAAFADILDGDALALRGDIAGASTRYEQAAAAATARSDARAALAAELGRFEAMGGNVPASVQAAAACDDADGGRARVAIARTARTGSAEQKRAQATIAWRVASDALTQGRIERSFRAAAVAAQLWQGIDDEQALAAANHARVQLAALVAETPGALAQRWQRDRDALALPDDRTAPPALATASNDVAAQRHERNEASWLRRLLALSRRLSSEPSLDRILDEALDTAIEICRAERGFVLLRAGDDFAVSVARGFASEGVTARDFSTQIARQAATAGEPVITIDAGTDARFDASHSIAALRLRSVLAVPLRFRGTTLGCLYIDHRLRDGAFDEDAVLRLRELADIAALAIGNAQLSAEIAGLNRGLADELALRERELASARARTTSHAPRTVGRFDAILGDSDAVTAMLAVVERACTTNLPVVIVGESGTGKELVARALHQHGPRRDGPFVAINCGALPDALLESELFGHARGAFTGALRDRAGLFEQAHGGTLFLDEIADTSLAMQTKLLRVLQDGSLRRVGDQQARTVDVRIVAATQSPLGELVAAGRFRDDLRFRLDVIAIAVPPLRERIADILPLARAFAARFGPGGKAPEFTRACERALLSYPWPGNVRELENAIARAIAMGGAVIDRADLPPALADHRSSGPHGTLTIGADLRLRPVLNATESAYIEAALTRSGGNQSAAAKLLGLSRFGLQKKMKRLADEAAAATTGDDDAE
jgi:transcriptional regulator with GAF, ATPase, and Fis domain/tRNA A-37 threonylcarbamoyl transferase component Bud32/tetratricopeptide (TPR) repeat protein